MRSPCLWAILLLGLLAPTAVAAQSADAAQSVPASEYRINAGDELEVYVWGEERLQRTVKVLPDGTMAFPLVGQIGAQGLLPQELERAISERLQGQYRGEVPQVTVSIVAASGMQFSVMGRVKSPGTFTPGRYVTVLEALSMAGGPNEFANLDDVLVLRKQGDRIRAFRVRLASIFKGGANLDNSGALASIGMIQPGDTVIVP
jgi:polysaccharide export outer membrane protein